MFLNVKISKSHFTLFCKDTIFFELANQLNSKLIEYTNYSPVELNAEMCLGGSLWALLSFQKKYFQQ